MGLIEKGAGDNLDIPMAVSKISKETEDLLKRLLTVDPRKRISWKEFFNHPVFTKFQNPIEDQEFMLNQHLLQRNILSDELPNEEEEVSQMGVVTRFERMEAEINQMQLASHFLKFQESYEHRRRISQFLFKISKNLLPKALDLSHFAPHYPLLMILQVLLMMKAWKIMELTIDSLLSKKNIFNLPVV